MESIKAENLKLLSNYNSMASIIANRLLDIERDKINFISFEPFDGVEIKRLYDEATAFQRVESENGYNLYIEPAEPYPGNRIVFVTDIPEKNIKKGDTGKIFRIKEKNINRKTSQFEIDLDCKKTVRVNSTSCVLDINFNFIYVAKIPVAGQKQFSNLQNIEYLKDESHFANTDSSIVCAIRVKGQIDQEVVSLAREFFYKIVPGAKKLEEEGKFSYLMLDSFPFTSNVKETMNNSYVLHRNTYDLTYDKDNIVQFKNNKIKIK